MNHLSRRSFLQHLSLAALATPIVAAAAQPAEAKRKILIAGAHPDDPETGCGGTMALLSRAGHEVVSLYLTRGEAGIPGTAYEEAARIRTAEAQKACAMLGCRPLFVGQIDGSTEITAERYREVRAILEQEKPDVVLTHWPIDTHRDHRICSMLVYDAWLRLDRPFALYYFEVMTGWQTQNFHPTDYVDISSVVELKHDACFAHVSQKLENDYAPSHGRMEGFRGLEGGFAYAEAFVRQMQSGGAELNR